MLIKVMVQRYLELTLPEAPFFSMMTHLLKGHAISDNSSLLFFDIYSRAAICREALNDTLGF